MFHSHVFKINQAQNWKTNNINKQPQRKVSKLKSKFSLILAFNPAQKSKGAENEDRGKMCTLFQ